ncbi:unnamed protein product, partial [Symbiodinium sp. KB8]
IVAVLFFRGKSRIWLSQAKRRETTRLLSGTLDVRSVLESVLRYVGAVVLLSPVNRLYYRLFRALRLEWEEHLTRGFLGCFLEAQCYGHRGGLLDLDDRRRDSLPDQRISSDVGKFTSLATTLGLDTLQAGIDLYFYAALLRTLSPALARTSLIGALVGTLVVQLLGRDLPSLYAAERSADGKFTYTLTRMRENAESILFYGGQRQETARADEVLKLRHRTEWDRLAQKDLVQLVGDQYRQVLGLCPALILVQFASGAKDAALLTQANEAFDAVLRALLLFADNCSDFSRLTAVAQELFIYHREQLEAKEAESEILVQPAEEASGSWLEVTGLTLCFADRVLVQDLSFCAPAEGGLLISGPSGSGKTTLLRALAGLWHWGRGSIRLAEHRDCLFLPQRPYMSLGTLRDQLLYPNGQVSIEDDALREILARVGLHSVLKRTGGSLDWTDRWDEQLSIGEQQRLSVARVLVQKPLYVLADEVTSANDPAHEEIVYRCIVSTCKAFVSVGHRKSLEAFHQWNLRLKGPDGRWLL